MWTVKRAARFIYESNMIESVTALTQEDIQRAIQARSSEGHVGAFLALMDIAAKKKPLTKADLFTAHRLILLEQLALESDWTPEDGLPPDIAPEVGGWRRRAVFIGGHTPPNYALVPAIMDDFFLDLSEFVLSPREDADAIDFAADMHYRYERIHPFIDGNGRTGRLIANYILALYDVPIAVFTSEDRFDSYYPACAHRSPDVMRQYLRLKIEKPDIALSIANIQEWLSHLPDKGE